MFSPLNQRRLANFKKNKRGFFAFWVFLALLCLTLPAEFIANDKPIFISFQGKGYFPVWNAYPETTFGGDFETEADYRDPYVENLISSQGGWALWPPIRYAYDTVNLDLLEPAPARPTWTLPKEICF